MHSLRPSYHKTPYQWDENERERRTKWALRQRQKGNINAQPEDAPDKMGDTYARPMKGPLRDREADVVVALEEAGIKWGERKILKKSPISPMFLPI